MLSRTSITAFAVKLGRLLHLIVCIMADEFSGTCMQVILFHGSVNQTLKIPTIYKS